MRMPGQGAMLESPFRKEFAAEYGDLMFINAEMARKTFSPAIVEELKQENTARAGLSAS